jgi:hypothetical protein
MGFDNNTNYSIGTGSNSNNAQVIIFEDRDPTAEDTNYPIKKQWFNRTLNNFWILESFDTTSGYPQAVWEQFGTSMEDIEQYAVLVGGASSTINSITPDASTTKVLVSGGSSANPSWQDIDEGALDLGTFGSTPNADGLTLSGSTLNMEPADATNPGGVSIAAQSFAGVKTFVSAPILPLTGVLQGNGASAVTNVTVTENGVVVGAASDSITSTSVGSTGQVLQGNTGAAPTYSTATYPSTTTANQILYSSATNTVAGLATAINGVLVTDNAAGVPSILANSGTPGYVLTANSGAPPSWQAGSVQSLSVNIQDFTSSGTYTPTAGMVYCKIECIGAGGGGGACSVGSGGSLTASVGGGGSSGSYSWGYYSAATIAASNFTVTIGAGGAGGGYPSGGGATGGSSDYGSFIIGAGGLGATGGADTGSGGAIAVAGASATNGVGGQVNIPGNSGGAGQFSLAGTLASVTGGKGGASYFGGSPDIAVGTTDSGSAGVTATPNVGAANTGAGGGGAGNISTATSQPVGAAGANGAAGRVIITEFIAS